MGTGATGWTSRGAGRGTGGTTKGCGVGIGGFGAGVIAADAGVGFGPVFSLSESEFISISESSPIFLTWILCVISMAFCLARSKAFLRMASIFGSTGFFGGSTLAGGGVDLGLVGVGPGGGDVGDRAGFERERDLRGESFGRRERLRDRLGERERLRGDRERLGRERRGERRKERDRRGDRRYDGERLPRRERDRLRDRERLLRPRDRLRLRERERDLRRPDLERDFLLLRSFFPVLCESNFNAFDPGGCRIIHNLALSFRFSSYVLSCLSLLTPLIDLPFIATTRSPFSKSGCPG